MFANGCLRDAPPSSFRSCAKRRWSAPGPEEKRANAINLCTALWLGIAIVGTSYSSGVKSMASQSQLSRVQERGCIPVRSTIERQRVAWFQATPHCASGDPASSLGFPSFAWSPEDTSSGRLSLEIRRKPLPVADTGAAPDPQPRLRRVVAKQTRRRHCGKAEEPFLSVKGKKWVLICAGPSRRKRSSLGDNSPLFPLITPIKGGGGNRDRQRTEQLETEAPPRGGRHCHPPGRHLRHGRLPAGDAPRPAGHPPGGPLPGPGRTGVGGRF